MLMKWEGSRAELCRAPKNLESISEKSEKPRNGRNTGKKFFSGLLRFFFYQPVQKIFVMAISSDIFTVPFINLNRLSDSFEKGSDSGRKNMKAKETFQPPPPPPNAPGPPLPSET